jgi:hypothetical protein
MFQSLNNDFRNFCNVFKMSVNRVVQQNSNNFIVGLVAVNHSETTNWNGIYQQISVGQIFFG